MKRVYLGIIAAGLLSAALLLAGCNSNDRTRISSILQTPDKYISRDVVIAGNVTKSYAVNLIIAEAGAYQVDDGTGKIWVITKNGVPADGAQVGVKGTVSSGVKLGREVFGTVIHEGERRTR